MRKQNSGLPKDVYGPFGNTVRNKFGNMFGNTFQASLRVFRARLETSLESDPSCCFGLDGKLPDAASETGLETALSMSEPNVTTIFGIQVWKQVFETSSYPPPIGMTTPPLETSLAASLGTRLETSSRPL